MGLVGIFLLYLLTNCAPIKQLPTPDQAAAIEQFLITQSVEFGLNKDDVRPVPLAPGETIALDTTYLTAEKRFFIRAQSSVVGRTRITTYVRNNTSQLPDSNSGPGIRNGTMSILFWPTAGSERCDSFRTA